MSSDTQPAAPAATAPDAEINALEALLESMQRIESGIGGICELAIAIRERPETSGKWRLRRDDYHVVDSVRSALDAARRDERGRVTVLAIDLARILAILDRLEAG